MIPIFLSALGVGFSGAMMPGSLLTYTIKQSLAAGPRAGFIIALGHALLEILLIFLIFLGLDAILQSSTAQIIIGILGGLLLMYIGIGMIIKSARNKVSIQLDKQDATAKNMLLSGALISASNPYFVLWWAVIGLSFLMQSYYAFGYLGVFIFFLGHTLADFIWYGFISLFVGKTRRFIKEQPYRVAIAVLGGLLVFFGAKFLFDAFILI